MDHLLEKNGADERSADCLSMSSSAAFVKTGAAPANCVTPAKSTENRSPGSRSRLGVQEQPERTVNFRTPFFDLDSVYGNGPSGSRQLYDPADPAELKVGSGGLFEDVPRDAAIVALLIPPFKAPALLGDSRNDENIILSMANCRFVRVPEGFRDPGGSCRARPGRPVPASTGNYWLGAALIASVETVSADHGAFRGR
jgi:Animal haem peroxidase